jgi:hypothetical protein
LIRILLFAERRIATAYLGRFIRILKLFRRKSTHSIAKTTISIYVRFLVPAIVFAVLPEPFRRYPEWASEGPLIGQPTFGFLSHDHQTEVSEAGNEIFINENVVLKHT